MVHGLKEVDVLEGFPCARLEGEHECRVWRVPDSRSQPLQEGHGLIAKRRLVDLYSAGTDEVGEHFVKEDQVRFAAEKDNDLVAAWCDPALVLRPEVLVALFPAERPRDPAPHGARPEVLA